MKKEDCQIGTRVADKVIIKMKDLVPDEPDCNTRFGAVVQISEKYNKVLVKWDGDYWPTPVEMDLKDLMTEEEANKVLNKLEEEYKEFIKPVLSKVAEASKLLLEAESLALKKLDKGLFDLYDVTYPLMNALDEIGWHTSSMSC